MLTSPTKVIPKRLQSSGNLLSNPQGVLLASPAKSNFMAKRTAKFSQSSRNVIGSLHTSLPVVIEEENLLNCEPLTATVLVNKNLKSNNCNMFEEVHESIDESSSVSNSSLTVSELPIKHLQ